MWPKPLPPPYKTWFYKCFRSGSQTFWLQTMSYITFKQIRAYTNLSISFYMCRIKLSMDFTFQIVTCVTKYTKSRKYYTRVSSKNNRNQLVFYFLISGIIFLIRISFFLKRFSTMIEPEEKCPYHVPSKRKHWTLL